MPSRTLETWPHGAIMLDAQHTRFALWAPDAFYVSVELENGKSIAMLPQKKLLPLTGYVHGGCSPVGMKKQFVTVYDESCLAQQTMLVSGGRIGTQIECAPADLIRAARAITAKIIF